MTNSEKIEQNEQNIRTALRDYGRYTTSTDVLDDVSPDFIHALALKSTIEKVVEIVEESCVADFPTFEYVEAPRFRSFRDRLDACSWDFGWGEEEDWFAPEDLPEEYAAAYEALLDYYSSVELKELREAYGDRVILDLYESEFGDYEQEEFPDFDYKSCG